MKPPKGVSLKSATYYEDYKFRFVFTNGIESIVDFKPMITYGESLRQFLEIAKFKKIEIDNDRGDIFWGKNWEMCFHIHDYYNETSVIPNQPKLMIPAINSYVVFDKESCSKKDYEKYYKKTFDNKLFVFLGEIKQCAGHCILTDLKDGRIIGMFDTDNFREATEDEI